VRLQQRALDERAQRRDGVGRSSSERFVVRVFENDAWRTCADTVLLDPSAQYMDRL
jgi:hypothetical protein